MPSSKVRYKPTAYCTATQGEIFAVLSNGSCTRSLGALIAVNTPLILFLDCVSLSEAACVCKLWWAEIYSPNKLETLCSIYSGCSDIARAFYPRFLLNWERRKVVWRLAMVGEYERTDLEYLKFLQKIRLSHLTDLPYSALSEDQTTKAFLGSHPAQFVGIIQRDVDRTFPSRFWFSRPPAEHQWTAGQQSLFRLLMYVASKTNLGYCQGMNFIAGVFLDVFDCNEELALRCFNALLAKPDIGPLFDKSLWLTKAYCCYLDYLVLVYLPRLAQHFKALHLTAVTYGLQWIITLLAYDMPLDALVFVWDQLILSGPSIVFQTILGLLNQIQDTLISSSFEQCLKRLKGLTSEARVTVDDLIMYANRFPIPRDISWEAQHVFTATSQRQDATNNSVVLSAVPQQQHLPVAKSPSRTGFFYLFSSCAETHPETSSYICDPSFH